MSKITWYVKENESFLPKEEYHAGTFRKNEDIVFNVQVWNNRWGVSDETAIQNPVVSFSFGHYEDTSLFEVCEVVENDRNSLPVIAKEGKASVLLTNSLSGKANDGSDAGASNRENFIDIRFTFKTKGIELKENDLKRIYFNINELT